MGRQDNNEMNKLCDWPFKKFNKRVGKQVLAIVSLPVAAAVAGLKPATLGQWGECFTTVPLTTGHH